MNSENYSVEITITPEDAKFTERCEAAGLPLVVISMYKSALKKLVADEREACAKVCDEALLQLNETANQIEESEYMEKCVIQGAMTQSVKLGKAIRARSEK